MHSLAVSLLNGLKLPADLSAGVSSLKQMLIDNSQTSLSSPLPKLPEKQHVHSSDDKRQGYLEALHYIHQYKPNFSAETLYLLHQKLLHYVDGAGGCFKSSDNVLFSTQESGVTSRLHTPIAAVDIAQAMDSLIVSFHDRLSLYEPLVVVPLTLLDFILIHPFHDGNGRMFRLLSVLLMYQAGFSSARDLKFDSILEHSRGSGQIALSAAIPRWYEGQHDVLPWLRYYLGAMSYAALQMKTVSIA